MWGLYKECDKKVLFPPLSTLEMKCRRQACRFSLTRPLFVCKYGYVFHLTQNQWLPFRVKFAFNCWPPKQESEALGKIDEIELILEMLHISFPFCFYVCPTVLFSGFQFVKQCRVEETFMFSGWNVWNQPAWASAGGRLFVWARLGKSSTPSFLGWSSEAHQDHWASDWGMALASGQGRHWCVGVRVLDDGGEHD